jgi:hypothetical protein
MKPKHRRSRGGGFTPSILITGILLYGGLWWTQHADMIEFLR